MIGASEDAAITTATESSYSGQVISYRKLLGQLGGRGNAATIAH